MSRAEERLSAIAEMVAVELGSDQAEVDLWKELIRAVDVKRFERTGEIVVRETALEKAVEEAYRAPGVRRAAADRLHYDPFQVRAAMDRLRRRARRASAGWTSRPPRELSVPDVDEPNYDSTDTELWLFGPLS